MIPTIARRRSYTVELTFQFRCGQCPARNPLFRAAKFPSTQVHRALCHRRTPKVAARNWTVNSNSVSVMPSSAPTIHLSCASKVSNDLPNATKFKPPAFSSDQGIERRRTKASGEKLSCAVRFTCDERGAPVSSLLSRLRATVIDE